MTMAQSSYDDTQLQKLFDEMEPKRRAQALRGAFRKEANQVRKNALTTLRSTGIHTSSEMEKGIRASVYTRTAGFRVTIGTKVKQVKSYKDIGGGLSVEEKRKRVLGWHINRRNQALPILIWAESGDTQRQTRSGAYRGSMMGSEAHFFTRAFEQSKDSVTDDIHMATRTEIERVAKRYGCK